jgi:prolyl oligopeptidase
MLRWRPLVPRPVNTMRLNPPSRALARALMAAAILPATARTEPSKMNYPDAPPAPVVDDYHGIKVADPYRWLEEAEAPATARWVDAQNALTRSLLDGPDRDAIRKRLSELFDYPRVSVPARKGTRYFYTRNPGLLNQAILYVRDGLTGPERVLLDPNTLTTDGTAALTAASVSHDGALLAYGISRSGSDRQEILVRDVATGQDRADRLQWAKFTTITWTKDGAGFFYIRFPQPGAVPAGDENYFAKVFHHRLGEPQEKDSLVFEAPEDRQVIFQTDITDDGRFLVIHSFKGSSEDGEVHLLDVAAAGARPALLPFTKGFRHTYSFAGDSGGRLFFRTNEGAPMGRLIAVDYGKGSTEAVPIVAESQDKLAEAAVLGGKLVLVRMVNASDRVSVHSLDGALEREIPLPGLGTVTSLSGQPDLDEMFLGFTSFTAPITPYRYDLAQKQLAPFEATKGRIDPADYEVSQAFFPSKDGTRVSMFLVQRKGLAKDGRRPVLLSGYGGFNISIKPAFDPSDFVWLERGGIIAQANLRGGGEYGEAWHQAGMLDRKQNVFDDFIAAAEWLIANGYTRKDKLAIQGGSNGGLLVGAVMTQRPDLVGAVLCQVPVADMLRYHLFTVGRFWIPEYGSADDAAQFPFLLHYSPYHNVKDGVSYPATLITTADTDDRVSPGMAKKFGARLQAATKGDAPILVRVETKAGHGAGKPISKQLDEQADIFRFLTWRLGVPGGRGAGAAVTE